MKKLLFLLLFPSYSFGFAQQPNNTGFTTLIFFGLIFTIIYFLIIRPKLNKQNKERSVKNDAMSESLIAKSKKRVSKKIHVISLILVITFIGLSWSFLISRHLQQDLWDVEISHLYKTYQVNNEYCNQEDKKISEYSSHVHALAEGLQDSRYSLFAYSKSFAQLSNQIYKSYSAVDKIIDTWNGTFSNDTKPLKKILETNDLYQGSGLSPLRGDPYYLGDINHSIDHYSEMYKLVYLNSVPQQINPSDYITESVILTSDLVHDVIAIKKNKELKKLRMHVFISTLASFLVSLFLAYFIYYKNWNTRFLWAFLIINILILVN